MAKKTKTKKKARASMMPDLSDSPIKGDPNTVIGSPKFFTMEPGDPNIARGRYEEKYLRGPKEPPTMMASCPKCGRQHQMSGDVIQIDCVCGLSETYPIAT